MKRLQTTLLGLFLLVTFVASAQKLKEKKDIVYLDDAPQYKLEKASGNLLKGVSYRATSMNGDTLIRYHFKSLSIPGLPHESVGTFWSFFLVENVETKQTVEMDILAKRNLMEENQKYGVIKENKVTQEGWEALAKAHQDFLSSREEMDSVAVHRKALNANKDYKAYAQTLVKRSRWDDELTVSGSDIMMGSMIGTPTKIGAIKVASDNNYGKLYSITRPNGKQLATVFFEKAKNRIYTRTDFDGIGKETIVDPSEFNARQLTVEIKKLIMNGYL